jgi:hypothetical protein
MKKIIFFIYLIFVISTNSFSQKTQFKERDVNTNVIQGIYMELGFGNSFSYVSATRLGLNFRTKNNWHLNLDFDTYVNDEFYPIKINSYLLGDLSLRLGKQYRKGIWLYGAAIGPSYFFKNRVSDVSNFVVADFNFSSTIGISPKVSIIAVPTRWFGLGISYNYNLNAIESTNLLWFSIYLGKMRYKLKDYQIIN